MSERTNRKSFENYEISIKIVTTKQRKSCEKSCTRETETSE